MRTDFGQHLRRQREAARLTRSALALKAGLSSATIKFLETGRLAHTSKATAVRLIQVAELSLSWADFEGVVKARNVPSITRLLADLVVALDRHHPSVLRAVLAELRTPQESGSSVAP